MSGVDPARGVFLDECGRRPLDDPPPGPRGARHAGAPGRCRATADRGPPCLAGMSPAMTVEGGTDTAVFAAYLEHVLLPALSPGMLVVVDSVGAHQPELIGELVAAAGCELVFLAAYSPDLSPIEEALRKIKALVKALPRAPGQPWPPRSPPHWSQSLQPTPPAGSLTRDTSPDKLPENRCEDRISSVDVAVAFDDELAGGGVGVDELRQQWDAHGDGDAHGELFPRCQRRG